jgi:hypothetical protein
VTAYVASSLKRERRTKAEMTSFRRAVWDIVAANRPCTARQVYYRCVVAGLVAKDTGKSRANETKVGAALNVMRENGIDHGCYARWKSEELQGAILGATATGPEGTAAYRARRRLQILPFEWITDNTRTRFQADQYDDKDEALEDMARMYRRDLWRQQPRHVEVWCESDSIGGVLMDVTDEYGVALLPCRGQSGKRFIFDSARAYRAKGKPVTCLYVGDFDPNGLDIGNSVRDRLARYGARNVVFARLAIEPGQVADMDLPGHGLNPNIAASVRARFCDACDWWGIPREAVEAEAMAPDDLRQIVREAIEAHIDQRQWDLELAVEKEERKGLFELAGIDEDEDEP